MFEGINDTSDDSQHAAQRTHTANQDEFEANLDLVDCSECGRQFNLGAQSYFGPRCPRCRTDG